MPALFAGHAQAEMGDGGPMDDRRLAELAANQGGVVSAAQLRACGLSDSGIAGRCANARLFRVLRSAYSLSPCVDEWGRRWAAVLATDPERAIVSHWSAAEIHRMMEPRGGPVHVTMPGSGRAGVAGVVVHRSRSLDRDDVLLIDGLRVTSPERTMLDVAGASEDVAVGRMIREGEFQGILRAGAIRSAVAACRGHHGIARLRRCDPATAEDALPQNPLEDELDHLLVQARAPGLVRQLRVRGTSGALARVDFACPGARLAIEADGRSAHGRTSAFESDRARDADLGAVGWQTLRFTAIQIRTTPATVQRTVMQTIRVRWTDPTGPHAPAASTPPTSAASDVAA